MPTSDLTEHLRDVLASLTDTLPGTGWRRMFGCEAAFVDGKIFGLIWKEGRIGLKLPDPSRYASLLSQPGAAPWAPGNMRMTHWVLVPEQFHDAIDQLEPWVRESHALVTALPVKLPASAAAPAGGTGHAASVKKPQGSKKAAATARAATTKSAGGGVKKAAAAKKKVAAPKKAAAASKPRAAVRRPARSTAR